MIEFTKLKKGFSYEIFPKGQGFNELFLTNWLNEKNILNANENILSYEDIIEWDSVGSETYISTFKVITNFNEKTIIAKALVTMNPILDVFKWAKRRQFLFQNNIPVSNWYWFGEGLILEEYYPYNYKSVENFEELIKISTTLDSLGYKTLKFLDDIRCDSNGNPFYVDFGFDLGDSSSEKSQNAVNFLKKAFPNRIYEIESYIKSII